MNLIPLLILLRYVVRIIVNRWWLYQARVYITCEGIRRMEGIVSVGFCRSITYHWFLLLSIHIVHGLLIIITPIIGCSTSHGWLFLRQKKNYINLYKISYLIYLTFNNRFHEEITFLLNILVRILRDFEKSIRIVTNNNQTQYRFEN